MFEIVVPHTLVSYKDGPLGRCHLIFSNNFTDGTFDGNQDF